MELPYNAVIAIPTKSGQVLRATLDPVTRLWTCEDEPTQQWLNSSKPYPPIKEPGTYDPDPLYTVARSAADTLGGTVEYCYEQPFDPNAIY